MADDVKTKEKTESLESLRKADDNLRLPTVPERTLFPKEIGIAPAREQTPAVGQTCETPPNMPNSLILQEIHLTRF